MTIRQFLYILCLASALGLAVNLASPNAIPYIGDWRELSTGGGPIIPPEAAAGDPPFIAIDVAHVEFVGGEAIFIDARDPSEFECGTIPGSINMPFEQLPDGDLGPYFDSSFSGAPSDTPLITFCSGEECDLSLHLARNLQAEGYTHVLIFFGGAREWEKSGLEFQRRASCAE